MFDGLIGKPLQEVVAHFAQNGIECTVSRDDTNAKADAQLVVRITDAYHLVSMGFRLQA